MDAIALGKTQVKVSRLGVGTWAWGDTRVWGYGKLFGDDDVAAAFRASLEAGVTLVDTAEMYGSGMSETLVGRLAKGTAAVVATKFLPLPLRGPSALPGALEGSLERLGIKTVDLYQIHWPVPWMSIPKLMHRLADAAELRERRHRRRQVIDSVNGV